ncbi:hypothetical protein PCG10_006040 [Penicillium crustosum]|uniref:Uncharacterized protein n=1 Tax=Penicillium crustosum TaxID=36656 RepID=A0A9P5KY28_PENCR|nr:uncharacterized protein N7487_003228 [Penicillium crustosum]KAF7524135.1 hypothetical protein PCG10_006040 [Penicillium crustosum]KAJ5419678.1 hypothetical protein N7487_003228 [Penicillium crustosum]
MAPIDPNNPSFGFDQPAFDSQAFLNGLGLDIDTPFNFSNGFSDYEIPRELLERIGERIVSLSPDEVDQDLGFDQPTSTSLVNYSAQPMTYNLPAHAPYSQVSYDPSIGIPYTLEDTDADKVGKWENLIAHANLAKAGMPPSPPRLIQEEIVGQSPQSVDSPNSLFESPGPSSPEASSPDASSAEASSVEIVAAPYATPSTLSPPQAPAITMAPSNGATNVTANAIPRTVNLPRALTNPKGCAQHVSPFTPVTTVNPLPDSGPHSRELENARSRIQSLVKERNYYQRNLRKATAVDPKTGKTTLQMLQAQNTSLRRINAKQAQDLQQLKEAAQQQKDQFAALGDKYNVLVIELHKNTLELRELKGQ